MTDLRDLQKHSLLIRTCTFDGRGTLTERAPGTVRGHMSTQAMLIAFRTGAKDFITCSDLAFDGFTWCWHSRCVGV